MPSFVGRLKRVPSFLGRLNRSPLLLPSYLGRLNLLPSATRPPVVRGFAALVLAFAGGLSSSCVVLDARLVLGSDRFGGRGVRVSGFLKVKVKVNCASGGPLARRDRGWWVAGFAWRVGGGGVRSGLRELRSGRVLRDAVRGVIVRWGGGW